MSSSFKIPSRQGEDASTYVALAVLGLALLVSLAIYIFYIWLRVFLRRKPKTAISTIQGFRRVPFHRGDGGEFITDECTICLDEYEEGADVLVLPCKHEFHPACIERWMAKRHGACPVCMCIYK
ncbi:hypothetical protein Tsubulata_010263 [Turnera subulata]|uniref:RING-type domain-containing protein n=1 Tax=Turnera subulata TaxID=218843 RepID=A0A9Q0J753_9ROSI|nr:hypothetical protein Tsubulata_010263 [Turnera subulata]